MNLALLFLTLLAAQPKARTYHPMTIAAMAAQDPAHWKGMRTHILVEGFVTYVKKEEDGDIHIRLCDPAAVKVMDRAHCVVAECIPALPCKKPKPGVKTKAWGISRFDGENGHRWWELHPLEGIQQ